MITPCGAKVYDLELENFVEGAWGNQILGSSQTFIGEDDMEKIIDIKSCQRNFILDVTTKIEREMDRQGVSCRAMADHLSINKLSMIRILKGQVPLTLCLVSDIFFYLGCELKLCADSLMGK